MAKKNVKPEYDYDMFEALSEISSTKGIPSAVLIENIKNSIRKACKTYFDNDDVEFGDSYIYNSDESADTVLDENAEAEKIRSFVASLKTIKIKKTVVERVTNPNKEIFDWSARELYPNAKLGDRVAVPVDLKQMGRISVQNAKSVFRQGVRDKEREIALKEFKEKERQIVTATVVNIDEKTENATIKIGKSTATLTKAEQVGLKELKEGDTVKVYIAEFKENDPEQEMMMKKGKGKNKNKGPKAIISRTSEDFIKQLFDDEVPEVHEGVVQIKKVAREPGSRSKMAVLSTIEHVDAVGACIGKEGMRIKNVTKELGDEKIDIVEYKEDPKEYIEEALKPATIISVTVNEEEKKCRVIVPDDKLSLAIGPKGQNAKLAAKLTGYKIDIKPESAPLDEETKDTLIENNESTDENNGEILKEPVTDEAAASVEEMVTVEGSAADQENNAGQETVE
ncbi:MAG: transcription termination/antitermination protein NusA [Clostridia bacterium]|nr:transcription termination/antitermination protein NusA [Clostridia bacterium]